MAKIYGMYFSGTDTTKKIVEFLADQLAKEKNLEKIIYDFTLPDRRKGYPKFEKDDIVVFGTPVIARRVPNVLLPYLKTIEGNQAAAVPVVLYGNRDYDDALIELRDLLEADGFRTLAAGAFVGEHSFSKTLAAGRPDEEDLKIVEDFAHNIGKILETWDGTHPIPVRGESPYRFYYQPRDRYGNSIDIRKVKPKVNDRCNGCGRCVSVCPMGSISKDDVSQYTGICIKCGACIKKCPEHARYYDDEGYLYHKKELEEMYERRANPEIFI